MSYETRERDKGIEMSIYGDNSNVLHLVAKRSTSCLISAGLARGIPFYTYTSVPLIDKTIVPLLHEGCIARRSGQR
jgi:hypothetical protein